MTERTEASTNTLLADLLLYQLQQQQQQLANEAINRRCWAAHTASAQFFREGQIRCRKVDLLSVAEPASAFCIP